MLTRDRDGGCNPVRDLTLRINRSGTTAALFGYLVIGYAVLRGHLFSVRGMLCRGPSYSGFHPCMMRPLGT